MLNGPPCINKVLPTYLFFLPTDDAVVACFESYAVFEKGSGAKLNQSVVGSLGRSPGPPCCLGLDLY